MKMLKARTKLLIAVSLIIGLVACGSDISEGEVTGKTYRVAWTQSSVIMVGTVIIPQVINHPEAWFLLIAEGQKTGYCNVSRADWDRINIGEWIKCN